VSTGLVCLTLRSFQCLAHSFPHVLNLRSLSTAADQPPCSIETLLESPQSGNQRQLKSSHREMKTHVSFNGDSRQRSSKENSTGYV